jgi:hypothetical protein
MNNGGDLLCKVGGDAPKINSQPPPLEKDKYVQFGRCMTVVNVILALMVGAPQRPAVALIPTEGTLPCVYCALSIAFMASASVLICAMYKLEGFDIWGERRWRLLFSQGFVF